jgi:hypothetical protein
MKGSFCKAIPLLMLAAVAVSNGFDLDTRPSPWTFGAVLDEFSTEPLGLLILVR